MIETAKAYRSFLAKQMRDERKERDELLNQLNNDSENENIKEQRRKEIMETFVTKVDKIKYQTYKYDTTKDIFDTLKIHDDKPGVLLSSRIRKNAKGKETWSLLETRRINIDGIEIEYIISITNWWKWIVDDCQIRDSFKINDYKVIEKFVDKVIFSYEDLIKNRKTISKDPEERKQEIKSSYILEWFAHNLWYDRHKRITSIKRLKNLIKEVPYLYNYLSKISNKFSDWVKHADLDDETIIKQILYKMWWSKQKRRKEKEQNMD